MTSAEARFNKSLPASTETRRLVRTDSPGSPPRLSHSSWTAGWLIDDRLYSAQYFPLSWADSLPLHVILHAGMTGYFTFWISTEALAWLMPHETAAISAQVLCTPYNHAPCHFMQSHIRKAYACLAVTCHLHFRQNDRDLLRATAVTLTGWNGYQNKS